MFQIVECPGIDRLKLLMEGRLGDNESNAIEEHFLACEACQRQTREMYQSDTLADAIKKQAAQSEELSIPPKLATMMQRLREQSLVGTQSPDLDGTQIIPSSSGSKFSNDRTEFLSGLRPAEAPDELARLDGFRLLKLLGHGGMGAVFLAEDTRLKRRVAVKLLRPEFANRQAATERFLREAQAVAAVRHENVVAIYQVGQDQEVPFLAQELLEGETLDNRLKREHALPLVDAVTIGEQIAKGLAAAHSQGLIHRDIKPANVWLEGSHREAYESAQANVQTIYEESGVSSHAKHTEDQQVDAEEIRVKLLDFGLARALTDTQGLTQPGVLLGTPAYMAPEQARGEVVDQRADLFSLGGVLYECVTGKRPFKGNTPMSILHALASETPAPVKSLRPDAPDKLCDLIAQLLEKNQNVRPASAQDVARRLADIRRSLAEPATAAPRRRPFLQIALSVVTVLVLCGVIIIKLTDKDGRETKLTLTVPDEAKEVSVDVRSNPDHDKPAAKAVPKQDEGTSKPPLAEQSNDPDRRIATALLKLGATVEIKPRSAGDTLWLDASGKRGAKEPPTPPFVVYRVSFYAEQAFDDDTLKMLNELRSLNCVEFWGAAVTDSGMRHLADLTWLKTLAFSGTPVTDDGMRFIANLSGLTHLQVLENNGTTSKAMSHLANLSKLEWLDWYMTATDEGLTNLQNLTEINHLRLDGSPINGSGLKHLSQLSKLRFLGLGGTMIDEANAQHWPDMPALADLHLHYTRAGDEVAKRIKSFKSLATVNFEGTRLTNAGVADLVELPALSQFGFSQTGVTEAAFPQLAQMKSLASVDLRSIQFTENTVQNLAKIPSLRRIRVHPKQLSDEIKSIMKAELPKCQVEEY